jgi:hypothetical protein
VFIISTQDLRGLPRLLGYDAPWLAHWVSCFYSPL